SARRIRRRYLMSPWQAFLARSTPCARDSKRHRHSVAERRLSIFWRCDMASLIGRGLRYIGALFAEALDRVADPRVEVQMALEEGRRQHQLLTEQAAAVLGNERELEIKVGRAMVEVERLRTAAGRALVLADRAFRAGDESTARSHEETASLFAVQLAGAESAATELAEARDQ